MSKMLKAYALYALGIAAVLGYAAWQYSRQTGQSIFELFDQARQRARTE